jgi:hypothetical protein
MRVAVSVLTGVAVSVTAALPLASLGHGLEAYHGWVTWSALVLGICSGILAWNITPDSSASPARSFWDWLMIGVFTCASARAFFWLIYEDGDAWKILSPNNLGDLSLHLAFIHWLAATVQWWPASPILAGDPLRYPLGSDLFNSLLLVAGVPVVQGLLWCGLVGAALSGYALWCWGRGIALAALLFNGGMALEVIFLNAGLTGVMHWLGGEPDAMAEWKNLFLTLFVTQRGFLFALPTGLLLLSAWRDENFGRDRKISLPLPVQALFLAVMPLFSIHAALYLGVAMIGVALASSREAKIRFAKLALISWPFMAFFGWLVATGAGGPSAVHALGWNLGWMSDGTVFFWVKNFGIALPLVVLLVPLLFLPNGSCEARAFVLPAALIFLCCMLIRFAPWPWDNMKLMLWSWIAIVPYLWNLMIKDRPLVFRAAAWILLFGSGVITLMAGLDGRHGYELIKRDALNEAAWVMKDIPSEDVIACAPEYNHPVLILGHPIVCGYEGHLWSHGLDYQGRLALLNSVMMGESGWKEKAQKLGASWIYWSDLESKRWPDSKLPWVKESSPTLHFLKD